MGRSSLPTIAACLALCGPVLAQPRERPPVLVVEDLLSDDWKATREAREEAVALGAKVLPEVLRARATHPRERPLCDRILRVVVGVLATDVARPLDDPLREVAAFGGLGGFLGFRPQHEGTPGERVELRLEDLDDLGSIEAPEPLERAERRRRAERAKAAIRLLGPALTTELLRVPPPREQVVEVALLEVALDVYAAERERALREPEAEFLARYAGLADLAMPIVVTGIQDEDATVRARFAAIHERSLQEALGLLAAEDAALREVGEATLLRWGPLALETLAAQEGPTARRLERWIEFGLDGELVLRLGHDFAGYAELPYRERRAQVIELERLGGEQAIPALRALLELEPSVDVRALAAIGLFRLGDRTGAEWLAVHSLELPQGQLSPRELAAIHMDQGLRYLKLKRLERAEREFQRVLECEPENEVAWYNLACTYARWGRHDEAFAHLEQAVARGFTDVEHIRKDPDLESLHQDPRFAALLESLQQETPDEKKERDR
ncbi:MAG: tetratricopeptide repeat protein [Planctomycetota bacterium]